MLIAISGCGVQESVISTSPTPTDSSQRFGGVLAGRTITDSEWSQVVNRTLKSVVKVSLDGCDFRGTASAFFARNLLITNRHVVEDATEVTVVLPDGKRVVANSWGWSDTDDLGWIRIDDLYSYPQLPLADGAPVPGDLVAGVGYPLGGKRTVERGRVFDFIEPYEVDDSATMLTRTTNEILPGDSGGPVINADGEVAGVIFAMDLKDSLSLSIPLDRLKAFLADLPEARHLPEC